ncbi:MAG TPA: hypothetical protein VKK31_00385 [Thermoanaerobaculia bacterium]|nr:hypothetical protein [Thermoanaerobaculia bacterium]
MHRVSKSWFFALLAAFCTFPMGAAPLRVTLESNAIVTSGVQPQGRIVLFGLTREIGPDDFPTVRRHLTVLADDDGDGTVVYPLEGGVPLRSLWAAADLASGDFDAAAPEKLGLRRANWRGRGLERRRDGRDAVEDGRPLLELLAVRPKVGAWALRVGDGDGTDGDGAIDGRLSGVLDQLQPLAGSPPPPATFERGDLVLAIDPAAMEIVLVKVAEAPKEERP